MECFWLDGKLTHVNSCNSCNSLYLSNITFLYLAQKRNKGFSNNITNYRVEIIPTSGRNVVGEICGVLKIQMCGIINNSKNIRFKLSSFTAFSKFCCK